MNYLLINGMHVDLDRCQLHGNDTVTSLEPKVTEVLAMLARHQGEVVSQQKLLAEVWAGTVVEANALQRCIGQLRKAFDDNARSPRIIATHPKKGYSLIPQVRWQETLPTEPPSPQGEKPGASRVHTFYPSALAGGLAVLALCTLAIALFTPSQQNEAAVVSGTPGEQAGGRTEELPAALRQANDFFAVYSPDGRYVVYPKLEKKQQGHLWARDLVNGREFLITEKEGNYPYSAWSTDSRQIAYVTSDTTTGCYSVHTVAIPLADSGALSPEQTLTECSDATLLSPQWLGSTSLAWIEFSSGHGRIVIHDMTLSGQRLAYYNEGKIPYYLSYSPKARKLAIAQTTGKQLELAMLDPFSGESKVLYSTETDAGNAAGWHPVWNQDATGVLITARGQTVNISVDGTVTPLALPYFPSQGAEL